MNLSGVITQLITLFLLMFSGYIVARIGLVTPDFRKKLSSFTLNTACPCIIISSVLESESAPSDMIGAVGTAVVFYLFLAALSAVIVRVARSAKEERGLDQLMLIFTNVGFMGIPIIQSFYGAEGVALLSMFILIFNVFFFSYGVFLIRRGVQFSLKSLLNSCIIAALIGLFFGVTGLHLPAPIENTLASIGSMNTPLAMMIIGTSMAFSDVRAVLKNRRLYRISLLRMLLMPLLTLLVVKLLPIGNMLAGICVILAAMPIAGNCGMISDVYTPEDMTASHAIILSTLMSALTLPIFCALITMLL